MGSLEILNAADPTTQQSVATRHFVEAAIAAIPVDVDIAKFSALIGTGSSTSISVTHPLNTVDVVASVKDVATLAIVDCDITITDATHVTFAFAVAPALNAYRVTIIG